MTTKPNVPATKRKQVDPWTFDGEKFGRLYGVSPYSLNLTLEKGVWFLNFPASVPDDPVVSFPTAPPAQVVPS